MRFLRIGPGDRLPGPISLVVLALAACASAAAAEMSVPAGDLRIAADACATRIHLLARDVALSTVLNRLAQRFHFELHFRDDDDPKVDFAGASDLTTLLAKLLPRGNISIVTSRSSRCPGQFGVVAVSVLPSGRTVDVPRPVTRPAQPFHSATDTPVDPLYAQSHAAALNVPAHAR